ncbi:MAG TPA: hypothetical protein VIG41_05200 [Micrococcaceae bacterium]
MTDLYPSQTVEYVPQPITEHGTIITTGVQFSIVPNGQPPGSWTPAVIQDGTTCFLLSGKTPGLYRKWAQVTAGAEVAVLDCGTLTVV